MAKNFVTKALVVAGLIIAGTAASYAQTVTARAEVRRVAADKEHLQPVSASATILNSNAALNLTSEQRSQISAIGNEAASLQAERTRLWAEYRAVVARPDFDDDMSAAEAAPRMLRIVAINNRLADISNKEAVQVNGILNATQRAEVARLVAKVKADL